MAELASTGVRITQRKGDIAAARATCTFTELGFDVSIPYVVKRTEQDAYDWLYVLRPDGSEYLLKECFYGRRSVTPNDEHKLGGVAERLNAAVLKTVRPG